MKHLIAGLLLLAPANLLAQTGEWAPKPHDEKRGGSDKVSLQARVENNKGAWKAANVEIEQDRSRPYVYMSGFVNYNFQIYDITKTNTPKLIYQWTIEDPELHRGIGAMDGKYFKIDGRYYYAQSLQFQQGTPDEDLGAVIFDVTGLPDPKSVKEVARIRYPKSPGGFHNTFAYKHSTGRALYFTTINDQKALIYDLDKIVKGADPQQSIVGTVFNPTPFKQIGAGGYHDFYVAWDPATKQDKFYGAGLGGYSTWDVTDPAQPKQLFTITSLGMDLAHTFTPSPDGRYAVTETEYQYSPLRIWDLKDAQAGRPRMSMYRSRYGTRTGRRWCTTTKCAGPMSSSRRMRTGSRSSASRIPRIRRRSAAGTPASASTRRDSAGRPRTDGRPSTA
jgi:hypothetical protein